MKKSAIERILHGEGGVESFELDERSRDASSRLCDCDDKMIKLLQDNDELATAYKNAMDALTEVWSMESEMHFKEGFAFGVMLGLEIAGYQK